MQQVGVPDQNVTLARMKILRLQPVFVNQLANPRLIFRLVGAISITLKVRFGDPNVLAEDERKAVATGIVNQRSGIGMNVFEGDPRGREITEWIGGHVDRVRMDALLRTLVGGDGLQHLGIPIHQYAKPVEQAGVLESGKTERPFCGD